jgi:hypothetical protein
MHSVITRLGSPLVQAEKENEIRFDLRFLNDSKGLPFMAQVLLLVSNSKAPGGGADRAPHIPHKNPNPPLKHRYA